MKNDNINDKRKRKLTKENNTFRVSLAETESNMKANDENLKEELKRREFIEAHEESNSEYDNDESETEDTIEECEKVRSFLDNKRQQKDFANLDYRCKLCNYGVNSKILLKVHMTTEHGIEYNSAI